MNYMVKKVLEHHHIEYLNFHKIQTGLFNTTYQISTPGQTKDLILRMAPDENVGMIFYEKNMMTREPEIHQQVLNNTSIPAPQIVIHDFSKEIIPHFYVIMEFMEGKAMSEIPVSFKEQEHIFFQTGRYLKELHDSVISNSYGYPKNDFMDKQSTWKDAFSIMWSNLIDDITSCGVYNQSESDFAKNQLQQHIKAFERAIPASLLHMDIWSQNILLDSQNNISAILDWDRGFYGDPEIEFAVLEYVGFMNDAFKRGYGNMPKQTPEYEIRRIFYYLYEFQKYLVIWTLRRPNRSMVNNYKNYALKMLNKIE